MAKEKPQNKETGNVNLMEIRRGKNCSKVAEINNKKCYRESARCPLGLAVNVTDELQEGCSGGPVGTGARFQ